MSWQTTTGRVQSLVLCEMSKEVSFDVNMASDSLSHVEEDAFKS